MAIGTSQGRGQCGKSLVPAALGAGSWHSPQEAWGHRAAMGTAGDTSSPTPPTPPPQTLAPPFPGAAANCGTKVPLWGPAVGTAGWWHRARAPSDTGDGPVSPYHDGVAGAGGQEDVLGVGGDAVALLQEPRHVLPHQLDAGAGAVGTWGHRGDIRGSREGTWGWFVSPGALTGALATTGCQQPLGPVLGVRRDGFVVHELWVHTQGCHLGVGDSGSAPDAWVPSRSPLSHPPRPVPVPGGGR